MEKHQLINDLKSKIIEQLNLVDVDPATINDNDPLFGEGMGLDSIDGLEIVVILERDYNITIAEIESLTPHFASLSTLADFVAEHTAVAA
ncbi:MAG: phosphopantetheine-binding protein [Saprospiraceae bacterium]